MIEIATKMLTKSGTSQREKKVEEKMKENNPSSQWNSHKTFIGVEAHKLDKCWVRVFFRTKTGGNIQTWISTDITEIMHTNTNTHTHTEQWLIRYTSFIIHDLWVDWLVNYNNNKNNEKKEEKIRLKKKGARNKKKVAPRNNNRLETGLKLLKWI